LWLKFFFIFFYVTLEFAAICGNEHKSLVQSQCGDVFKASILLAVWNCQLNGRRALFLIFNERYGALIYLLDGRELMRKMHTHKKHKSDV